MKTLEGRKVVRSVLIAAVIGVVAFSSARAQDAAPTTYPAPVYPNGPGGRDVPGTPTPRPNPLPTFYDASLPIARRVEDLGGIL